MGEPSKYEQVTWDEIQAFRHSWWRTTGQRLNDKAAELVSKAARDAGEFVERHPKLQAGLNRASKVAKRAAGTVSKGVPYEAKEWFGKAAHSAGVTFRDISRIGLTPKRIIAKHQKKGNQVETLLDIRSLDLELVDKVRGGNIVLSYLYPLTAGGSGAGSALVISGGEFAIIPTAGAAAAPGVAAVTAAVTADITFVFGLVSRAVGAVGLFYGYDPKGPGEQLFVSAVVNAGSATTSAAKMAAMADLSRLTQALFRNKAWKELNKHAITKAVAEFAARFGTNLTKKSLGKFVPIAGIGLGFVFNWATVSGIVKTAYIAYRRRFLLDKYPQLAATEQPIDATDIPDSESEHADVISIVDLLAEHGGPDLRHPDSALEADTDE